MIDTLKLAGLFVGTVLAVGVILKLLDVVWRLLGW